MEKTDYAKKIRFACDFLNLKTFDKDFLDAHEIPYELIGWDFDNEDIYLINNSIVRCARR